MSTKGITKRNIQFKGMIDPTKKKELIQIYKDLIKELKTKDNNDKFIRLILNLDLNNNDKTIELFLISLYCNVFYHYYGQKKGQLGEKIEFTPFNNCKKYVVFTFYNKYTEKLLEKLVYYFNTDANNIQSVTGKIMQDLRKMDIRITL